MPTYHIEGGHLLNGEVTISGAKMPLWPSSPPPFW